ncbi:MAG: hypothetical protein Q9174_002422 [Haloplaca sp. 1 TL-2023]
MSPRAPSNPLVFAHYMLIMQPSANDYTTDINLAKEVGISAFAVNYGGWNVDWALHSTHLATFYTQAAAQNFHLFLSFDLTSVTDPSMIVNITNTYASHPAQLKLPDGKILLSTFQTDPPAWNWQSDVLDKLTAPVIFIPGTLSNDASALFSDSNPGDGTFPWIHPSASSSEEYALDIALASQRSQSSSADKKWMAPLAPWFFKRLGPGMNWANAQDDSIFIDRWTSLLQLKPDFIELVT